MSNHSPAQNYNRTKIGSRAGANLHTLSAFSTDSQLCKNMYKIPHCWCTVVSMGCFYTHQYLNMKENKEFHYIACSNEIQMYLPKHNLGPISLNPLLHSHWKEPFVLWQIWEQGLLEHSSTSTVQVKSERGLIAHEATIMHRFQTFHFSCRCPSVPLFVLFVCPAFKECWPQFA